MPRLVAFGPLVMEKKKEMETPVTPLTTNDKGRYVSFRVSLVPLYKYVKGKAKMEKGNETQIRFFIDFTL